MGELKLCGLILAGGQGRRLGGVQKGLLEWQGRPLVSYAREALSATCDHLVISANTQLADYQPWADAIVTDGGWHDAGPLAGLLAGLHYAAGRHFDGVLVMPCDTPGVTPALMAQLAREAAAQPHQALLCSCKGDPHPLHGYYPVLLDRELEAFLAQGGRKVQNFVTAHAGAYCSLEAPAAAFRNLNTPECWVTG
ncbi:molybdenum cofactor guanylyltransferase MobA [Marinobacter sp. BGYM27]|uniref:molybdenum cofactor guanylyltransferase MobA n=1 Tax=unclassified Marinobacter TaxID=83889 RepID=UPI0021A8D682|nr:molybdenum cofactor guanylyltransferase MobA [Marinobacter sp. BGYM27]MDG5499885.1 molybdenum cofactor guanylyltransferase MobA [Marinobacter sp. BGYM27]